MKEQTNRLVMSKRAQRLEKLTRVIGESFLFGVTSISMLAVLFIFVFIAKDAFPFFAEHGFTEFFTSTEWFPASDTPKFGALANFYGTAMVTLGATVFAVPLGVLAAVCLSDILSFKVRQIVKPIIELLAAIPSVAFGFFALVILAPLLQNQGGLILSASAWVVGLPFLLLFLYLIQSYLRKNYKKYSFLGTVSLTFIGLGSIYYISAQLGDIEISSGTNALNVSFILGLMALPAIVSVSEDALQACGRDLREGSYALGATRAETIIKTVIPASLGGIIAAVILGIMRAIGETMVVWMASGNTAQIPTPWYNVLSPVRTLTASIAGDMGEAARGTQRYYVLFAMALSLLAVTFIMNIISQAVVNRQRKKLGK